LEINAVARRSNRRGEVQFRV